MINLMYVVLVAMLALNISSEVLNGFSVVEESLNRTTANSSKENQVLYDGFADQMKANPAKVKEWFDKATAVKRMSDSLYNYAQQLKLEIVREADGKDANVFDIKNKDNLEAASHVMLAPGTGQGRRLYNAINSFRERILAMVSDAHQVCHFYHPRAVRAVTDDQHLILRAQCAAQHRFHGVAAAALQ